MSILVKFVGIIVLPNINPFYYLARCSQYESVLEILYQLEI